VLKEDVDKPRPVAGQGHLVEQDGVMGGVLLVDKRVLGDVQAVELDVCRTAGGR